MALEAPAPGSKPVIAKMCLKKQSPHPGGIWDEG